MASKVTKPSLEELRVRDGFHFALCQNRDLLIVYVHGMSEREFIDENKQLLNNIIIRMQQFYNASFNCRPWLEVAIRQFFEDNDIPLYAVGNGMSSQRDTTKVNWATRTIAHRKVERVNG